MGQPRDTIGYEKIAGRGTAYYVRVGGHRFGVVRLVSKAHWSATMRSVRGTIAGRGATRREAVAELLGKLAEMETPDA